MRCPYCAYPESKVIDSRPTDENNSIRRRRECLSCGKRFTTYETVESVPLVVVKKDGSRQSFDRQKLLNGMVRACDKRSVTLQTLEQAVADIEQRLLNSMDREIPTERVGDFDTELVEEFFYGFVRNCPCSLHIQQLAGSNSHHIIEGAFKSVARSLRQAVSIDSACADQIPSTKGVL